jgi:hypothetical protein
MMASLFQRKPPAAQVQRPIHREHATCMTVGDPVVSHPSGPARSGPGARTARMPCSARAAAGTTGGGGGACPARQLAERIHGCSWSCSWVHAALCDSDGVLCGCDGVMHLAPPPAMPCHAWVTIRPADLQTGLAQSPAGLRPSSSAVVVWCRRSYFPVMPLQSALQDVTIPCGAAVRRVCCWGHPRAGMWSRCSAASTQART